MDSTTNLLLGAILVCSVVSAGFVTRDQVTETARYVFYGCAGVLALMLWVGVSAWIERTTQAREARAMAKAEAKNPGIGLRQQGVLSIVGGSLLAALGIGMAALGMAAAAGLLKALRPAEMWFLAAVGLAIALWGARRIHAGRRTRAAGVAVQEQARSAP